MNNAQPSVFLDRDSVDRNDLDFAALDSALPELTSYGSTSPDQTLSRIKGAEVVISNKVVIDADMLARCPTIKLIVIAATGTNNVDLKAAAREQVTVCNVRDYATSSVAQHVFALILSLARNLGRYSRAVGDGRWNESPFFCLLDYPILDLRDKTLGIIGYGVLGRAVAEIGEAFGMNILVAARPGEASHDGRTAIEELLERSDMISLHCPLVPETRHLIDAAALARMRPDAVLINTARGGIVDEQALLEALERNQIAGAGIDVLEVEPPDGSSPLLGKRLDNLIVTPHNAWASRRCRQQLVDQMVAVIDSWRDGRPVNRVN